MSLRYWAWGMGDNSTAAIIDDVKRGKRIDLILAANPGAERKKTMAFVPVFSEWLKSRGYPGVIEVKLAKTTLYDDCMRRKALPAVAYGKFKTCSLRFKREPQDRFLNQWPPAVEAWARGEKIIKCIGYHAGEPDRAKPYSDDKFINEYPLIDRGIDGDGCLEIIRSVGLTPPGKSSCTFCPNMKQHEIERLIEEEPEAVEAALRMEANADLDDIVGLGRNFRWRDVVDYYRNQIRFDFMGKAASMPCECFDGT